jgi:RecA-family ATPase
MAVTLAKLLEDKAPMPYICFPLLPKKSRMIIGAPSKSKKSMLALNLAYDLAQGGKFIKWDIESPQKVLYVEQEIGVYGVRKRLKAIQGFKGGDIAPYNLNVVYKGNKRFSLDDGSPGLVNLRSEIERTQPDVLILDPLRRFTHHDEDSSTEMVKVFQVLDELQQEFNLTQVVVHHASKRSEQRDRSDPESLRGSSFIFDDGDSYIMLDFPVKGDMNKIRLNFRFRHAADIPAQLVQFDDTSNTFSLVETK